MSSAKPNTVGSSRLCSDNCSLTLTVTPNIVSCANLGANSVILLGTDGAGNTASASATVTVVDNTDATISAPADVTVNVDASGSAVQGSTADAQQLGQAIGQAVQAQLIKEKRAGGLLA